MIKLKDILFNEADVFGNTSNASNGAEAEIEDAFDDLEKDNIGWSCFIIRRNI